jgi:hypothetical protein
MIVVLKTLAKHVAARLRERAFCVAFEDDLERGWPNQIWFTKALNRLTLLRHDPEFRAVRREHLHEVGKRVRLKEDLNIFARMQ